MDDRILQRLGECGPGAAWEVAFNLTDRTARVRRWCRVLTGVDFVDVDRRDGLADRFLITSAGRGYLLGEYGVDLRRPVPGPRPPEGVRPVSGVYPSDL
jgi:hypothetical protein